MIRHDPTHDTPGAQAARKIYPGSSYCHRCGYPWRHPNRPLPCTVEPHVTNYTHTRGCFPLCESCWTTLGHPEARIEYYGLLIEEWDASAPPGEHTTPDDRAAIARAVANGK